MMRPAVWLREYVRPDLDARELATRLAMTGTEVERIHRHGVDALDALRGRARAGRRSAPGRRPAARLPRRRRRRPSRDDRLRRAERRRRARPWPSRGRAR